MSNVSLYRRYRPQTFDDVVGQPAVVRSLKSSILHNKISHAYLFCGTRGTGKTSLAKIFARAINCPHAQQANPCNQCTICTNILENRLLDVIEMDAASNNSVEHIRRICEEVHFAPTTCKYKVYIIDEFHMLSTGAFNALLKTLEEPPAHVVFLLATTDPQRIPATILSRCQRYDLQTIPLEDLKERLTFIAKENHILADDSALLTLAQLGKGSLRDALSLLDQCQNQFAQTNFSREDVLDMAGLSSDENLYRLLLTLLKVDYAACLLASDKLLQKGLSPLRLAQDMAQFLRDILVFHLLHGNRTLLTYPERRLQMLDTLCRLLPLETTRSLLIDLAKLMEQMKKSMEERIALELFLLSSMEKYMKGLETERREQQEQLQSFLEEEYKQNSLNLDLSTSASKRAEKAQQKHISQLPTTPPSLQGGQASHLDLNSLTIQEPEIPQSTVAREILAEDEEKILSSKNKAAAPLGEEIENARLTQPSKSLESLSKQAAKLQEANFISEITAPTLASSEKPRQFETENKEDKPKPSSVDERPIEKIVKMKAEQPEKNLENPAFTQLFNQEELPSSSPWENFENSEEETDKALLELQTDLFQWAELGNQGEGNFLPEHTSTNYEEESSTSSTTIMGDTEKAKITSGEERQETSIAQSNLASYIFPASSPWKDLKEAMKSEQSSLLLLCHTLEPQWNPQLGELTFHLSSRDSLSEELCKVEKRQNLEKLAMRHLGFPVKISFMIEEKNTPEENPEEWTDKLLQITQTMHIPIQWEDE